MDAPREDDVLLLEDEKFDFDLSLSSASANEDEDEVFFGPVGHRERCLAARVELRLQTPEQPAPPKPSPGDQWPWLPLAGDAFVEVYKEAHLLALQIESARKAASALPAQPGSQAGEHFVQEPEAKISLFEREEAARRSPQALKRETFCVSDRTGPAPLPVPRGPTPGQTAAQKRGGSQQLPRAPSLRLRALEKPHLANGTQPARDPPASPARSEPRREEPPRAQRPAVRSLPVPHKGLKKTLLRPPGCAARKSSTSGAPAGQDGGQLLAAPGRPRPAGPLASCWQSRGPTEPAAEPTRTPAPHPQMPEPPARAPASRRSLSWSSRGVQTGAARRRESSLGPRTGVSSALAEPFKVPRSPAREPPGTVTPQFPRAQRPQPHTPAGRTPLHSTPAPSSIASRAGTPLTTRRLSSLPTPASCRLSSLPRATPRATPRALGSPLCASAQRLSSEPPRKGPQRTTSACVSDGHAASPDGSVSPPAAVPQALRFSPEPGEGTKSASVGQRPEALPAEVTPDQPTVAPLVEVDVPLIDFCSSPLPSAAPACPSRPLIDLLVNTPEWARGSAPKPRPDHEAVQLIDLASPLIQLSPAADKENVASPLVKL
ncbi:G2 and S phase-expressed protein 1 isoform X1 [Sorex araneus]|uniref:G2 and S phase-expressed protein 1 isoform X1 n=1 Tax=Sorex araneus TaxID=42254 RepID=UPI002433871B|nr:G2 and S phase-expressed protein 1 isoform X1 [Sorex araneus]